MHPPIYLINRDCDINRLHLFTKQIQHFALNFERISAINAVSLPSEEIDCWRPDPQNDFAYISRRLSNGEIGCYLSHMRAWKRIANSDTRGGFIFEDDVIFSEEALPFITTDQWIPNDVDVCQISSLRATKKQFATENIFPINRQYSLCTYLIPSSVGTQGYWISKKGAQKALTLSDKCRAPVDDFLYQAHYRFAKHVKVLFLNPAIVCEMDNATSVISQKRFEEKHIYKARKLSLWQRKWRKIRAYWLPKIRRYVPEPFVNIDT